MPSVLRGPCLSPYSGTKKAVFLQISFAKGEKVDSSLDAIDVHSILRVHQKKHPPPQTESIQRNKDNKKIPLSGRKGQKAQSFGARRTSPSWQAHQ